MMPMCRGSLAADEIHLKLSAMMMKRWTLAMAGLGLLLTVGCAKGTVDEPAPTVAPEPTDETQPVTPQPEQTTTERPAMTRAECEAGGGTLVGDIGDGAIHRPDYLCESGRPPMGTIRAEGGEPIAVEGEVCCPAAS